MDSNHDIVPTLRDFDGVMTGLAADEIERLRARLDVSFAGGVMPTHYCNVCNAMWRKWEDGSWNLRSKQCGKCCDNAPMGDQIVAMSHAPTGVDAPAVASGDEEEDSSDVTECADILDSLIAKIQKHGMYSMESTIGFLQGARACLPHTKRSGAS